MRILGRGSMEEGSLFEGGGGRGRTVHRLALQGRYAETDEFVIGHGVVRRVN